MSAAKINTLRRLVRPFGFLHNPGRDKCRCGHVRNSHGNDTPWARCGNTACRHERCDCEQFTMRPNVSVRRDAVAASPSTGLLACASCVYWQAEMHADDPLRAQGYGTCEFDVSPRIGDRTQGADGCGAHVQANISGAGRQPAPERQG
jgi:hypothetical protein